MIKDLKKFLTYSSAIITFILMLGSGAVNLFVNWNIISVASDGTIIIVPLVKSFWYITGATILSFSIYCFLAYKFFFDQYRYIFWTLFFGWLSLVLTILWQLAKPVPWYGLALGFFCLFALFWLFIRQVRILHFDYNPK